MGKSLKTLGKSLVNPLGKTNPLRPDNFTKNSIALMRNPFSKTAAHRAMGDYEYGKTTPTNDAGTSGVAGVSSAVNTQLPYWATVRRPTTWTK